MLKSVTDHLDQLVPSLLVKYDVEGAEVALILNGGVAWSAGYGLTSPVMGVPVTPSTDFQVASISKSVTAWGVMRLVERGKLDLDAPVERYLTRWHLPSSPFNASGVTIRRLLSHTAGLSRCDGGTPFGQPLPSLEDSLSGLSGAGEVSIVMEPGKQWSYSNGGYTLLQLVVEEVTGEPFSAYMKREVLEPLGMTNSSFEWRGDAGWPQPPCIFTEEAAGGLYTNARDLGLFVAAAMPGPNGEPAGRGVLKPDTLALMFTPAVQLQDPGDAWGLGYGLMALSDGGQLIRHGGSNPGYKAFFEAVPSWREGILILTNGDNGMSLVDDVASYVISQLVENTS